MMDARLPGVVLSGGLATRMGGGDKGLLPLGQGRVLDHILARLGLQCGPIALNANGDARRFARFGLPVIPDGIEGFPGPLAGVLAAMDWARAGGFSAVVTVAGDSPFFDRSLVKTLIFHAGKNQFAIAASAGTGQHAVTQPVFGLWPTRLRRRLHADILGGARKVGLWAQDNGARIAPFEGDAMAFFNINTPDDLVQAERLIRLQPPKAGA